MREWKPIGTSVPKLAGEYFLVTGSGKYFRNVILDPEDTTAIIQLDDKGENYPDLLGPLSMAADRQASCLPT